MSSITMFDLVRAMEAEGQAGVRRWPGPYLIELPVEQAAGSSDDTHAPQASSTARTVVFEEQLLLDLKRIRTHEAARVWSVGSSCVVGRGSACAIQLEGDEGVSAEHARIEEHPASSWRVVDLGSRAGTFVNRERVAANKPTTFPGLAAIAFGSRRFVFVPEEDLLALLTPVSTTSPLPVEVLRTELEAIGSRRFLLRHTAAYLVVAEPGAEGARATVKEAFALIPPGPLTIGRTSQASITIRRGSVSKWHARLLHRGEDAWAIEDTGSSNGTHVSGRKLEEGAPAIPLRQWDAIGLGPSVTATFVSGRGLMELLLEGLR